MKVKSNHHDQLHIWSHKMTFISISIETFDAKDIMAQPEGNLLSAVPLLYSLFLGRREGL